MTDGRSTKLIDIFAGPGGLGEGFASVEDTGGRRFEIALSIEKEVWAHRTLWLRSWFRHAKAQGNAATYYAYVRGGISISELRGSCHAASERADEEAWNIELGPETHREVTARVRAALDADADANWVLIGGPPCQAYSLVGRSRMRGSNPERFEADKRHFLYREYLRILAEHAPPAFVMENVKGVLSSKIGGESIFERILSDLQHPALALDLDRTFQPRYRLFSVSAPLNDQRQLFAQRQDFVVRCEDYGVPQARHRVIIFGLRADIFGDDYCPLYLEPVPKMSLQTVLADLPPMRSGISQNDSDGEWDRTIIQFMTKMAVAQDIGPDVAAVAQEALATFAAGRGRGGRFTPGNPSVLYRNGWFLDADLGGFLNHETRGHISEDLERYLFAACFGKARKRSPSLDDFPDRLLPDHANVEAGPGRIFNDRFRVQLSGQPSTTITSHISKDGHYYIHPDPGQCRSLTVREAARLQTFPDNYFFEGPRTSQYVQVGNAVPPILAAQVARIVRDALDRRA